jgi:hypothetical protein
LFQAAGIFISLGQIFRLLLASQQQFGLFDFRRSASNASA